MSIAMVEFKKAMDATLPRSRWELYRDMRSGTVNLLFVHGLHVASIAFTDWEIEMLRPLGWDRIDPYALRRLLSERLAGAEEWLRQVLKPDLQIEAAG